MDETVSTTKPLPTNDDWQRVRQALASDEWDFRTIDGLARDSGVPEDVVIQLLNSHTDEVRKSMVPDSKGRVLYTLSSRPFGWRELLATTQAFVSKST